MIDNKNFISNYLHNHIKFSSKLLGIYKYISNIKSNSLLSNLKRSL